MLLIALALLGPAPRVPTSFVLPHNIAGRVVDSSGSPLLNVRVVVIGANRPTTTGPDGKYLVRDLSPGGYSISFAAVGFLPIIRRVTLGDRDTTVNVTMRASLIELPALQVTATPLPTSLMTSPQPTAVVGGNDLRTAQAASLGETLRGVAGIHSLSTGVGIGKPVIRGLTSNRVLVLDNGQRMETQQWGDEHGPNIETATADRVEVIKGPASVLYGSDALGGVVNVVARDLPIAEDGHPVSHGSIAGGYGFNNRSPDGSLLIEGASGRFGYRGTFSGRVGKDLRTADYVLWNSGNEALAGSGTVGYRYRGGSLVVNLSNRTERISLTDEDPTASPTQRIATSRARLTAVIPTGRSHFEANVGFERNRRREFVERSSNEVALGLRSTTWTADGHFHHAPIGGLNGIVGFSGLKTDFSKFGAETLIPNSTVTSGGLFAYEQLETGRWNISIGGRLDQRRLAVESDADLGVVAATKTYGSATGNLGVLYRVSDPVALVLNLGRGYRAPSSFDLYSNGVHEGTVAFERGNPNLKNETSLNTDVAVRVQSRTALLEVGAFANRIRRFIYTVPAGETDPESGFEIFDVTQGNALLTGLEASVQFHPVAAIHFQAAADYTRGQNTTTQQPLPLIPPIRATYGVRFEGRSKGSLSEPYLAISGETNGKQARQDPAEASFYAAAFEGAGYQSHGYTLANLGGGLGIVAGGTLFRLDLMLRNVFNVAYADYLSRLKTSAPNPGIGRSFSIRFSSDF